MNYTAALHSLGRADEAIGQAVREGCQFVIGLYGGDETSELVLTVLGLGLMLALAILSMFYVYREIFTLGLALLKVVVAAAFLAFFAIWTWRLFSRLQERGSPSPGPPGAEPAPPWAILELAGRIWRV